MPTIQKILNDHLKNIDIELLLSAALNKPQVFLLTHPEKKVDFLSYWRFKNYLGQYKAGYSIAAITHHKEFYGLDFYVNKKVLIPRPATELMVDEALNEIKKNDSEIVLIDVGVGSGCVPITILKNLEKKPATFATDISKNATKVAKINAHRHQININFLNGDLLSPLLVKPDFLKNNLPLIITANLPYLTEKQFADEPSIQKEPKIALVADDKGLALYERLLQQIRDSLFNKKIILFLEIDPAQAELLPPIITALLPIAKIEIKKDLCGLNRLVKISIN